MLWEVEILPRTHDNEAARVNQELGLLTHANDLAAVSLASRGFLLEGELDQEAAQRLADELLVDPLVEVGRVGPLNAFRTARVDSQQHDALATVLLKPGVMDPVAESVALAGEDLKIPLDSVRTFRRYYHRQAITPAEQSVLFRKVLANEAIEQVIDGPLSLAHLARLGLSLREDRCADMRSRRRGADEAEP